MEHQSNQPTPDSIMQIGTGFWPSKILLSAVNFELFTKLAEKKSMSAAAIKKMLNLNCIDRHVYDFLDALTTLGFLSREGVWDTSVYSNSMNTDFFLDKKKPTYIGGILEMMNNRLYGFWGNLEEGLRTGEPQNEVKDGRNFFAEIYADPKQLNGFVNAMSGIQLGNFMTFAQKFDFSQYKTLSDIGGSGGVLCSMVATHQKHMSCTSVDLPPVGPIAAKTIEHFGVGDRVKVESGDFFKDAFPKSDIIVMGNILHDWDEDTKLMLMKKAFEAIPRGGAFVAIENIIDDERKRNVFGMMMSLNMLIETGKGFDYSFADFNKWAKAIGFQSTAILPLTGPSSAAIAFK